MATAQLKPSRYNHFFYIENDSTSKYLVYNALSNGLATLDPRLYDKLQSNSLTSEDIANPANREVIESLKRGLVLVEPDYDELAFVRLQSQLAKFRSDTLYLTIVTSHACNLNCGYCYERQSDSSLGLVQIHIGSDSSAAAPSETLPDTDDDERLYAIMEFVQGLISTCHYRAIRCTWYGGEPLLRIPLSTPFRQSSLRSVSPNTLHTRRWLLQTEPS